jgi:hypothetical protein
MNIFEAAYKAQFSVLLPATCTYLTALVAIAQTFCVEIAECTMQAGYDRAVWFYAVWATVHYSELPAMPEDYEVEPDFWFEPSERVAIASVTPAALPNFQSIALLSPAHDLEGYKENSIKSLYFRLALTPP